LSLSWRERLQRAKKRLMEQLGLSQEDWDFIWDNIGAFCSKSDEQVREVLESEGRPLTQEEVDKLVETMYQDEFDEMCRDIIIEVFENFGYEIKKKQKKKQSKKEEEETRLAKLEKTREDKIGYSFILIAVLALLGGVTLLVRISIPQSLLQIATTVPFLLLFETVIVFMNPYIEQFAANDPAWKLGSNFLLSLVIYPIHERVERFVRRRVGRVTKKTPTLYR